MSVRTGAPARERAPRGQMRGPPATSRGGAPSSRPRNSHFEPAPRDRWLRSNLKLVPASGGTPRLVACDAARNLRRSGARRVLGAIGFLRITLWSAFSDIYGAHWLLVAITVSVSLVGVVLWGTLSGSLLPFLLKRLGFDPAHRRLRSSQPSSMSRAW